MDERHGKVNSAKSFSLKINIPDMATMGIKTPVTL